MPKYSRPMNIDEMINVQEHLKALEIFDSRDSITGPELFNDVCHSDQIIFSAYLQSMNEIRAKGYLEWSKDGIISVNNKTREYQRLLKESLTPRNTYPNSIAPTNHQYSFWVKGYKKLLEFIWQIIIGIILLYIGFKFGWN